MHQFLHLSNLINEYSYHILLIILGITVVLSLFKISFKLYNAYIYLITPTLLMFVSFIIFITIILIFTQQAFLNRKYIALLIICIIIINTEVKKKKLSKLTRARLTQSQDKYRHFILGKYIRNMILIGIVIALEYYKYI